MHVIRVELENIKSYTNATFDFERGTTAIVGRNGAGKTTILEAIAWTLFDTLEYSKDDFLRRGAKKGSVRVTFESSYDGRQYVVYRDTGTNYYVFDPVLGARLAEKKTDTAAFLRAHLGIELGTDLRSLFRSAIGVPQGSFTSEFLLAPNARKAAFDRLLKVEEYREGADRLRETNNLIRDRIAEIREHIAGAEGQLARYDELVAEQKATLERERELETSLAELQAETQARETAVSKYDEAEQRVNETRLQADRLDSQKNAADQQLRAAERELATAQRASERQKATATEYQTHRAALEALQLLEAERAERDPLRNEEGRVSAMLASAASDIRRLDEALQRATQAGRAAEELNKAIEEQISLERERERLRDLRARAQAAGQACLRLDKDLEQLRLQHAQTRERVKVAEAARGAQRLVEKLESERLHIENELARERELATQRKFLSDQRREMEKEITRLKNVINSLTQEVRGYGELAANATHVNGLEARAQMLAEQAAQLRAEIARDEKMRVEVQGGLCPILSQKCLNIGEDQTLEGYFTDHLAANHETLVLVENERRQITTDVRAAREAAMAATRLESAQTRLAHEQELLREREASLAQLTAQLQSVSATNGNGQNRLRDMQTQMLGIDGELKTARDAALRYAELETQRGRLREIEDEGKRKKEERAELSAAAEATGALAEELAGLENRLQKLGDPRSRAAALRAEAERINILSGELQGAQDALAALEKQKAALQQELARFATLDARWAAEIARRDASINGFREYLASEQFAAMLPARQAEHTQAQTEAQRAARRADEARQKHTEALADYDRDKHTGERLALAQVRERAAVTGSQLNTTREQAQTRAIEIARLDEVRASLRAEFQVKERLEKLNETTDFIRDILKAAGPLVTESYLYNISLEANQLFRDITGEATRTLKWSRDYEIILEEDGYERSFVNLSGGEQMAAALSVRLALLKELSDIRLAFFDEPTVNMDAERRERLAVSIGQIRSFDQLFVISHDDTFEESVDHIVHVVKSEE